ncbi:MAG: site-specific integrase [Saprospiraceae bacterium]|nr:site-specific integrase [Saprospiraceae bacterium]
MEKVKFYLKKVETGKIAPIFLRFHINGKPFQYGSRKNIIPELWNNDTFRPITTKSIISKYESKYSNLRLELDNVKIHLDNLERSVLKHLKNMSLESSSISGPELRRLLNKEYNFYSGPEPKEKIKLDFEPFLDQFIQDITKGNRLIQNGKSKGKRYSQGTIKAYENLKHRLNQYKKTRGKKKLHYHHFDIDWYNDYISYANDKNYHLNSTGNTIKNLKSILNLSHDEGQHNERAYKVRAFKKLTSESTAVYLNEKEVDALRQLDLSSTRHLERIRDIFLIGCYTGLRYSDYSRIKPIHVKDKGTHKVIDMITHKTKERVIIPIRHQLELILSKYNYNTPRNHSQKVNQNIKIIAQKAKINSKIEVEKVIKGKTVIQQIPKFKMITTHTARRTCLSLMYLANIPTIDIMKISGHKTEKQLLTYIRVSKEETSDRLAMHPFFSGSKMKVI